VESKDNNIQVPDVSLCGKSSFWKVHCHLRWRHYKVIGFENLALTSIDDTDPTLSAWLRTGKLHLSGLLSCFIHYLIDALTIVVL
jgi:hypothetical protein